MKTYLLMSDIVLGQLITGVVTIIVAYIAYRTSIKVNKVVSDVQRLDVKVDGRLTELLALTKSEATQKGNIEGQDKAKADNLAMASDLDKQTETIIAAVKDAKQAPEPDAQPVVVVKNLDK